MPIRLVVRQCCAAIQGLEGANFALGRFVGRLHALCSSSDSTGIVLLRCSQAGIALQRFCWLWCLPLYIASYYHAGTASVQSMVHSFGGEKTSNDPIEGCERTMCCSIIIEASPLSHEPSKLRD